jgi:hypothetical protein
VPLDFKPLRHTTDSALVILRAFSEPLSHTGDSVLIKHDGLPALNAANSESSVRLCSLFLLHCAWGCSGLNASQSEALFARVVAAVRSSDQVQAAKTSSKPARAALRPHCQSVRRGFRLPLQPRKEPRRDEHKRDEEPQQRPFSLAKREMANPPRPNQRQKLRDATARSFLCR